MTRIWIDVEDLFHYAAASPRPSGIQRLSFEIQQALVQRFGTGGAVRFLRHDKVRGGFAEIAWDEVSALYRGMVSVAPRPATPPPAAGPLRPDRPRGALRRASDHLPTAIRDPLARAVRLQREFLGTVAAAGRVQAASWRALAGAVRAALRPARTGLNAPLPASAAEAFAAAVRPGDVLLVLGSPWSHHDYAGLVARTRARHGVRFALLVYDLIPVRHPEWCDGRLVASFTAWLDGVLPVADTLLAISEATARDVVRHAERAGIALRGPVTPIPIGTGFGTPPGEAPPSPGLPTPGSYALIVSTIEARKNHALLFRVWRRLLDEMPPGRVPTLVFAGRIGWLVDDLMRQMANTGFLDGRIVIIEDPSDAELAALYRGCLFTLFPSFYEGWGLPVTESLAFGKPCVISRAASLPEAGGSFARYFDPDDLHDAVRVIRAVLDDRDGLAAWEAQIRRDFRPTPWSASADAVVRALAPDLLETDLLRTDLQGAARTVSATP
jgi:glycosyltransferase involved in cell wall biosynthesis